MSSQKSLWINASLTILIIMDIVLAIALFRSRNEQVSDKYSKYFFDFQNYCSASSEIGSDGIMEYLNHSGVDLSLITSNTCMLIPTSSCVACVEKECNIIQQGLKTENKRITIISPQYLAKDLRVKFKGYDTCNLIFYDSSGSYTSPISDYGKIIYFSFLASNKIDNIFIPDISFPDFSESYLAKYMTQAY